MHTHQPHLDKRLCASSTYSISSHCLPVSGHQLKHDCSVCMGRCSEQTNVSIDRSEIPVCTLWMPKGGSEFNYSTLLKKYSPRGGSCRGPIPARSRLQPGKTTSTSKLHSFLPTNTIKYARLHIVSFDMRICSHPQVQEDPGTGKLLHQYKAYGCASARPMKLSNVVLS